MFSQLSFQPVAPLVIVFGLLLILVGLLAIGPSYLQLTLTRQRQLIATRLLVISLLAVALLRPGCVTSVEKQLSATLLVLIDISRSMELPHRGDDTSRWETLRTTLTQAETSMKSLKDQRIDVKYFWFDGQLATAATNESGIVFPELPTGTETDLGNAILQAMRQVRDQRILGVFLLSDGVQNVADTPIEVLDAGQLLADQEVPLLAVPFGLPAELGQLADIAITQLPEQHRARVKNRLQVRATMQARGFANKPITVELLVSSKDMPEQVVDTQFHTPTLPYEEQVVTMNYIPAQTGRFRMRLRAKSEVNEIAMRNNELPSFLNVYEGGSRVVYLEGNAGWEQKYLKKAIRGIGEGIELDFLLIYPQSRTQWPYGAQLTSVLSDPTIDVFIIGDLDAGALYQPQTQEQNLRVIEQAVASGKGLLTLGGLHSFGPGQYADTPLADVLPVRMRANEVQLFDRDIRRDLHIDREFRVVPTKEHFLTRIGSGADWRQAWQGLPPLNGANLFSSLKDNADVLLETESGEPILVATQYGKGRVISLATDQTWRWWRAGHDQEFQTFWEQILLWLAFRDEQQQNVVQIDLPRRRFQPFDSVDFTASARQTNGQAITNAEFTAELLTPDQKKFPIALAASGDKQWAQLDRQWLREPGIYVISVTADQAGAQLGNAEVEFVVFDQDSERANPSSDPELMTRLAEETKAYGGRAVLPEEFNSVLGDFAKNPPEMKVFVPLKWQLGQTVWDGSLFLLLFVIALTGEWYLRKRWGLA